MSGEIRPSSDGPSRIPAVTSPITGGCPMRRNRLPARRAAAVMTTRASSTCESVLVVRRVPPAATATATSRGGACR